MENVFRFSSELKKLDQRAVRHDGMDLHSVCGVLTSIPNLARTHHYHPFQLIRTVSILAELQLIRDARAYVMALVSADFDSSIDTCPTDLGVCSFGSLTWMRNSFKTD